ncbi:hypothetical protein [Priestia megaterium]|uniref:hypothetical protein n=1 Tax=Priestia megaterium TaxID=1404 RepID=UPI0015D4A6B9|nr:hypothetical protein [Priestia megaterium]
MKKFCELPKNVKKTIRYINQDASFEQLMLLKHHLNKAIENREKTYFNNKSKI